jgi:hypothetical protein
MAHKNGLQGSLDLTMESLISAPAAAAVPVVSKESQVSEPIHVAPAANAEKVHKVTKPAMPAWRQRGLCLSESIMMRLKLESLKTGKSLSEVVDDVLNRHLPNNRIAS